MKVVEPVTILPENIVESNLFDTAPILFNIGNTYSLNNYVSVVPVQFDLTNYVLKTKLEKSWNQ